MTYSHWLEFERTFDPEPHLEWFRQTWTISLWLSAAYVMLMFGGKRYMKDRDKFELRMPLAVWSSVLAAFSIMGMLRTVPDIFYQYHNGSLRHSVCDKHFCLSEGTAFWAYVFTISKAVELGDTLFIVLRKQPLVFLHWYHHVTVLIYCFYTYGQTTGSGRYFTAMNYTVHAIMYSYYALKAFRVSIPRWVNMVITSLQLLQMVAGVTINSLVLYYQNQGHTCTMGAMHIFFTFAMYASYLVLFADFFKNTYMKSRHQHKPRHEAFSNGKAKES